MFLQVSSSNLVGSDSWVHLFDNIKLCPLKFAHLGSGTYLSQKHTPNVPREINTCVCVFVRVCVSRALARAHTHTHTHTHTQKPLPVFKVFGNSIKDTRFRIYICALLCLWPRRKEPSRPSCSEEPHNKARPSCFCMQHNWKQYPQFRHLVLKHFLEALRYGLQTSEACLDREIKTGPAILLLWWMFFGVGFTAYMHRIGPHQVFVFINKTICLKYALNTLLTFTPVYAHS